MTTARCSQIASLYQRHAGTVRGLVTARVNAPPAVIEDACQTAWERLCAHDNVDLQPAAALGWLVVTATREAWKRARRREHPVGGWLAEPDCEGELAEPAGPSSDPCDLLIAREMHEQRIRLLGALTVRERGFLGLQALGLSYVEIAQRTGATVRTVERQIYRARRKLKARG